MNVSKSLNVGMGVEEEGRGKNQIFLYNQRDFIKCSGRNCVKYS